MDNRSTKQKILDAALDLFSTQGFEATSVSQIADRVGIRKASVYSHFASKQEILECLMQEVMKQYGRYTIFFGNGTVNQDLSVESITEMIVGHIQYITHDPQIVKGRKMLTVEQFRNPMLAKVQTKQNYTHVMNFFVTLIEKLTEHGILSDNGPEITAAQLCLPISMWINLCAREPERENEVIELIRRHIIRFFDMYSIKREK